MRGKPAARGISVGNLPGVISAGERHAALRCGRHRAGLDIAVDLPFERVAGRGMRGDGLVDCFDRRQIRVDLRCGCQRACVGSIYEPTLMSMLIAANNSAMRVSPNAAVNPASAARKV